MQTTVCKRWSHHRWMNTYPMQECLRVEKLPCVFLGKRESLFIIVSAGSTRAGVSSAIGESQKSSFRRWGMERVNWCGTTKAPMVSYYRTESCAKSPSCYRRRAPVRWRKDELTGDKHETPRCKRAKPKHTVRWPWGARRRAKSSTCWAPLCLVAKTRWIIQWDTSRSLQNQSASNCNVDLQLRLLLAPLGICPKFELSVHACARICEHPKKAESPVC